MADTPLHSLSDLLMRRAGGLMRRPTASDLPVDSETKAKPTESPASEAAGDRFELSPNEGQSGASSTADNLSPTRRAQTGHLSVQLSYEHLEQDANHTSYHGEFLKLDFSFLQTIAEQNPNQLAGLADSGSWQDFRDAVMNLDFKDDQSLQPYFDAAKNLFNEFENRLGMDSTGLDDVENMFTGAVQNFFDRVQSAEATECAPQSAPTLKGEMFANMGLLMQAGGDMDHARQGYQDALKLLPQDHDMTTLLERLHEFLKGIQNHDAEQGNAADVRQFPLTMQPDAFDQWM